ncbi:MAG: hypothetical protein U1F67_15145 [Rubrivivax sp.]
MFMLQNAYEVAQRAVTASDTLLLRSALDAFVAAGREAGQAGTGALRALMAWRRRCRFASLLPRCSAIDWCVRRSTSSSSVFWSAAVPRIGKTHVALDDAARR